MASRLNEYGALLGEIKRNGYAFLTARDYARRLSSGSPLPRKVCLLRVDVDSDPTTAFNMFARQRELGLQSTYYFRVSTFDAKIMRAIAAQGSEVGYHYEELATVAKRLGLFTREAVIAHMDVIQDEFRANMRRFSEVAGFAPETIASHGDFVNRALKIANTALISPRLRAEFGIVAEAYDAVFEETFDSRIIDRELPLLWSPETPQEAMKRGARIIRILVHPRQWHCSRAGNFRQEVTRIAEGVMFKSRAAARRIITGTAVGLICNVASSGIYAETTSQPPAMGKPASSCRTALAVPSDKPFRPGRGTEQIGRGLLYVSPAGSDMNDGSVGSPLRTLQAAADAARPGATVHVAPGVYDEVVHSQVDGTADAPIRFVSDVRGAAVIRPSGADGAVWVNRGDHVTIEGFEIDGSHSPAVRLGIDMQGSHVTVKNNHVHHILINGANDSDGGAGIVLDGARFGQTDQHAIGNLVHDIGADSPRVHGIYHQSTGSVVNNVVYNASQTGIVLWHDAHDVLIANNTVFSNRNGISVGAGDFYQAPSPANNVQVINNLVYDNTGIGIDEEGLTGTCNMYRNNLVYRNARNWGLQNGLTHTGTITADPQFVNYDPKGGGNYRLQPPSPAIDRGIAIEGLTYDIEGNARPQGRAIDIGAHEWIRASTRD